MIYPIFDFQDLPQKMLRDTLQVEHLLDDVT